MGVLIKSKSTGAKQREDGAWGWMIPSYISRRRINSTSSCFLATNKDGTVWKFVEWAQKGVSSKRNRLQNSV